MPAFNKVRVRVANAEYTVMSADSPEYINGLASRLNSQINTMMGEDGRISTVTALVPVSYTHLVLLYDAFVE